MNNLELRKILLVGYAFDAPAGAPMLHGDGLPMRVVECPIRMRFAFWIPQPEPFQRRDVGEFAEYLQSVVTQRAPNKDSAPVLGAMTAGSLAEYMREHGLEQHLMSVAEQPRGYTLVAAPLAFELQALRDGAIAEQIQDFTFPRQPSIDEMRAHLMPHWERRTLASLGYLPNQAPQDRATKPVIQFESV
jgi:hypothetical protein